MKLVYFWIVIMTLLVLFGIAGIITDKKIEQQQQQIEILTERVILLEETIAETGGIKLDMPK